MTVYVGKFVLVFLLCLQLCSCASTTSSEVLPDYGDFYFNIGEHFNETMEKDSLGGLGGVR